MALAHEVRSFFGGKVRERGHGYFERRAVSIDLGNAWNVQAWVRGTERYRVNLNRGPSGRNRGSSRLTAWCTCPFAEGGEACKHIWATVLAATAQGLLAGDGHSPITDFRLSALDDEEIAAGIDDPLTHGIGDPDLSDSELGDPDLIHAELRDLDTDSDSDVYDLAKPPASPSSNRARSERDGRDGRDERDRRDGRDGRREPGWRQQLATFLPPPTSPALAAPPPHAHTRQLVYVLDLEASGSNGSLTLEIGWRDRKVNGEWGRFRTKSYLRDEVMGASTPEDERILSLQHASDVGSNYSYGAYRRPVIANHIQLPPALVDVLLPGLCATGRCLLRRTPDDEEWAPLSWDAGDPWELRLELARETDGDGEGHGGGHGDADDAGAASSSAGSSDASGAREPSPAPTPLTLARTAVATLDTREDAKARNAAAAANAAARETCVLRGALHRGGERMEWSTALLILSGGHLVTPTHVARFTHRGDLGWIAFLAREGQLVIPCGDLDSLFAEMTKRPGAPLLDISPDLGVRMVKSPPRRRLSVRTAPDSGTRPLANDAVPAAPDAVRPRSDALRSASDSIRAAASRWRQADAARRDATRKNDDRDDDAPFDDDRGFDASRFDGARDDADLERGAPQRFRADQRLTSSRDTLHADVMFEYAYGHAAVGADGVPEREHTEDGSTSDANANAASAAASRAVGDLRGADGPRGVVSVRWDDATERLFVPGPPRTLVDRDRDAERDALMQLADAGLRPVPLSGAGSRTVWELRASRLPDVVRRLISQGWAIEAQGRKHRTATATRAQVRSGIDWFDLEGVVEFGDISAPIGVIVAALARGETAITLSDGSQGLLPEEWLTRHGPWAGLAERRGDSVRFTRGQVAVLDAWVAAAPAIDVDAQFAQAREALRAFTGVKAVDPPAEFQGELRAYQREGLGWIQFLGRFGFGGCLADDMGLGKTVQVLAALAGRRAASQNASVTRPSLVVVPRSLVFNWQREAARFAPSLRVLDHTGPNRQRDGAGFDTADLIITTYGTVRRDAELLARIDFDYVILDEAHAIKNVDSLTTKAVRLLRGRHRLALTGTPVQNHIGELWSLFEFLNPGMLGRSRAFARAMNNTSSGVPGAPRDALARVLRPFILRRTKADVARDLPARVEDTIVCRLSAAERQRYNELRDYYRQTLAQRITKEGWNKARLHVLKALLRLRQAACHPGLVDRSQLHASSAKLDVLLSDLRLLREEGHKTIVFSQFVRLLDIVRLSLDRDGVPYEYLDGRTRDREARVERFQTDPDCPLFLVSLKAGGLGLNLTAAEYVFLLDPWWNPAIEAQAIDRAHRIGQTKAVFAYRLIAEDTIEEKIIELQDRKRDLADAVVGADGGALQKLTREDLEVLLS